MLVLQVYHTHVILIILNNHCAMTFFSNLKHLVCAMLKHELRNI